MEWKQRRRPPFGRDEVAQVIRSLNVLGWIEAKPSEALAAADPELELMNC